MRRQERPSSVGSAKRRRPPEVPESIQADGYLYYYNYSEVRQRLQNQGEWMKQKGMIDRYRTRPYDRMTVWWDDRDRPVRYNGYVLFVR